MLTFHGDPEIKAYYLARVEAHRLADEVAQGTYYSRTGEQLRACAVGCTIHGSDHSAYERELGIPTWLAHVEDRVHEGLSLDDCKSWPSEFLSAVPVGVDLEPLKARYFIWLMDEMAPHAATHDGAAKAVAAVRALWVRVRDGGVVDDAEWNEARAAADDAYAPAAADAAAAYAAGADAAYAAAAAAYAAAYAAAPAAAARRAFYGRLRDWLLQELRAMEPA